MVHAKPGGLKLYNVDVWNDSWGLWPVFPYAVEETVREAVSSYDESGCKCFIAALILEGELFYSCDGEPEQTVRPGEIFTIPRGSDYRFRSAGARYRKLVFEAKGELLPAISERLRLDRPLHLASEFAAPFEKDVRSLGALLRARRQEDVPAMIAKTDEILVKLSLAANVSPDASMRLLAKAKSMLEREGASGVAEVAEELGVCVSTLNKLFNGALGVSPVRYRIQRKMERAKTLLSRSALSIKEIARKLGYSSQLCFSSDFKKRCGASPKAFRLACSTQTSLTPEKRSPARRVSAGANIRRG